MADDPPLHLRGPPRRVLGGLVIMIASGITLPAFIIAAVVTSDLDVVMILAVVFAVIFIASTIAGRLFEGARQAVITEAGILVRVGLSPQRTVEFGDITGHIITHEGRVVDGPTMGALHSVVVSFDQGSIILDSVEASQVEILLEGIGSSPTDDPISQGDGTFDNTGAGHRTRRLLVVFSIGAAIAVLLQGFSRFPDMILVLLETVACLLFFVGLLAFLAFMIRRMYPQRVSIMARGLTFHHSSRDRHIPWTDIEKVFLMDRGIPMPTEEPMEEVNDLAIQLRDSTQLQFAVTAEIARAVISFQRSRK